MDDHEKRKKTIIPIEKKDFTQIASHIPIQILIPSPHKLSKDYKEKQETIL